MNEEKTDLYNRIPAAFPGPKWDKIGGRNRQNIKGCGGCGGDACMPRQTSEGVRGFHESHFVLFSFFILVLL